MALPPNVGRFRCASARRRQLPRRSGGADGRLRPHQKTRPSHQAHDDLSPGQYVVKRRRARMAHGGDQPIARAACDEKQ